MTGNPSVPHDVVLPPVISVKPLYPLLYNQGFMNPSVGLPEAMRASLTSAATEDINGHDADVPEISARVPFQKKAKYKPCAETSGKARPSLRT